MQKTARLLTDADFRSPRARKSNAAYKEDLRKAAEEEKERLATREREKEKAAEVNTEKWERAR